MFIGGGVLAYNLACSGTHTTTAGTGTGQDFKPGIDFYSGAQGRVGRRATGARWRCATACARAYNGGAARGGTCVRIASGLTTRGEPQMGLQ